MNIVESLGLLRDETGLTYQRKDYYIQIVSNTKIFIH
jgi:hypothetical protein